MIARAGHQTSSRVAAWLGSWCLLFAGFAAQAGDQALLIHSAQMLIVADPADQGTVVEVVLPGEGAPWREVMLPFQWSRKGDDRPGLAWFRVELEVSDTPHADPAIYLSRLSVGGIFFINGTRIASMRGTDETTQMRWRRPHLVDIPPAVLRTGRNVLLARVVTRDAETFFPEVKFGDAIALRPEFDRRYLAEYTGAQFSVAASAAVAAFMLGIWWFRRSELLYLLFGLTCTFWALRTQTYLIESVPWVWWWPWRAIYSVWIGCFALSVAAFFLCYIDRLVLRWRLALIAYAMAGPLLLLVSNGALQSIVEHYWIGGLFVLEFYVLWSFYVWLRQHPRMEGFALASAAFITFVLAANDFAVRSGWLPYSYSYAIHFGAPIVMLAMGALLAARFVRVLRQVEGANAELTRKVREREHELSHRYDQLREAERIEARSAERQRIMQDMHDGLGSQLLTSLAAVERGALDPKGMAQVLRDAMDEMRLAIDTLAPDGGGLLEALGNLRFRLEPRFRAAGIALRFIQRGLPERIDVAAEDALQILRVLQESLGNTIKHAGARQVNVEIALEENPRRFVLAVSDDGAGFDTAVDPPRPGRGLSGMRRRAARIGAELEIASGASGTRITLAYPLMPDA